MLNPKPVKYTEQATSKDLSQKEKYSFLMEEKCKDNCNWFFAPVRNCSVREVLFAGLRPNKQMRVQCAAVHGGMG